MKTYLKPGFGYYDLTNYTIGGDFKRNGNKRQEITSIEVIPFRYGCNRVGVMGGVRIAFNSDSVKEAPDGQE